MTLSRVRPDLDAAWDFDDDDGNVYNFYQYELGQTVERFDEDDQEWYEGTLCRIDNADHGLPWGVSDVVIDDIDTGEWHWINPQFVREVGPYVIDEEEDVPMAVNL